VDTLEELVMVIGADRNIPQTLNMIKRARAILAKARPE